MRPADTGVQLSGVYEFDKLRNQRTINAANQPYILNPQGQQYAVGTVVPFLAPVAQHQFNYQITSGRYDFTTLPFAYPIRRIYLVGATPGNIYELDIIADGNLVFQATAKDIAEANAQYNLQTGSPNYIPSTGGGYFGLAAGISGSEGQVPQTIPNGPLTLGFQGSTSIPFPWDVAAIFDVSGRQWESLVVSSSLIVRTYSNITQNVTLVAETLPGAFLG